MMVVALVFLILSPILAQLIYFALSRRREYLADASGAMYTRWPEGLASALEKLGGARVPQADQSKVTAPMYIVRPLRAGERRSLSAAFSTHPPLEQRIRILRGMGGTPIFAHTIAYSPKSRAGMSSAPGHWERLRAREPSRPLRPTRGKRRISVCAPRRTPSWPVPGTGGSAAPVAARP
jgi:heat shock protein HtpX